MAKVTFVIGLCGSGKTFLSERLAADTGAELFEGLVEKQVTDIPKLLRFLTGGTDCIVEEICFCIPGNREWIIGQIRQEAPNTQIVWMCYENDFDAANWNVTHRTNKGEAERHKEINGRVQSQYTYPSGCTPIPITRIPITDCPT